MLYWFVDFTETVPSASEEPLMEETAAVEPNERVYFHVIQKFSALYIKWHTESLFSICT